MASSKNTFIDRDKGWKELSARFKVGHEQAHIGYLRSSGTHDSKSSTQSLTMAALASVHEFGSSDGRIPERSFMRTAMDENKDKLTTLVKKISAQIIDGYLKPKQGLGLVAEFVAGLIRNRILSGPFTPLAAQTITKKGSSKPLIDTGQLLSTIEWEIRAVKKGDK